MAVRWRMLAVLFLARVAMAFQFQAPGSLSSALSTAYAVDLAAVGTLIGLYLAPGVALALPGGWIGARFGETRVVGVGLGLMVAGALLPVLAGSWEAELAGRLIAGLGAILLNVLMTKMVADWFAGREIATAMALFVNSWPVGIALALLVLPPLADLSGLDAGAGAVAAVTGGGLVLFAAGYRAPEGSGSGTVAGTWPKGRMALAVVAAGCVWGLYNAAIAMIFGFGPSILMEQGWGSVAAGQATSLVLWFMAVTVPLGGIAADRSGHPDRVLAGSILALGACLAGAATGSAVAFWFALAGLVGGIAAGPIMSLPARVLGPATRAVGIGLYWTLYYILMAGLPALAGWLAVVWGSAAVTLGVGAACAALSVLALWSFHRLSAPGRT